jgi:hypothetical protein
MAYWPKPPVVPRVLGYFQSHVSEDVGSLFEYPQLCHKIAERLSSEHTVLRQTVQEAERELAARTSQIKFQRGVHDRVVDRLQGTLITAEAERLNALSAAALTVKTPETTPLPHEAAETAPADAARTSTTPAAGTPCYSRKPRKRKRDSLHRDTACQFWRRDGLEHGPPTFPVRQSDRCLFSLSKDRTPCPRLPNA